MEKSQKWHFVGFERNFLLEQAERVAIDPVTIQIE